MAPPRAAASWGQTLRPIVPLAAFVSDRHRPGAVVGTGAKADDESPLRVAYSAELSRAPYECDLAP